MIAVIAPASAFRSRGVGEERAQRAPGFTLLRFPIKPIPLAGRADELLRVFVDAVAVVIRAGVVALRVVIRKHRLLCVQLIPADLAREHLRATGLQIERPTRAALHDRYRQRPAGMADFEALDVVIGDDLVVFVERIT